jgi:hypothetical protein
MLAVHALTPTEGPRETHGLHATAPAAVSARFAPQIGGLTMRRLYEWEVRFGSRHWLSSCGVTDAPLRARSRMLDAVAAAPTDEVARGSVTAMELALPHDYYDYFQTLALVERDTQGTVRWLVPQPVPKVLIYTDLSGRLRTAIDLRETNGKEPHT